MAKVLELKVKYEDKLRRVEADEVKEEQMKLIALKDGRKVAEFPSDKVEHWSLNSE